MSVHRVPPLAAVPAILRRLRRHGLGDVEVAQLMGVHRRSVLRWSIGRGCPQRHRYGLAVLVRAVMARDRNGHFVVLDDAARDPVTA